MGAYFSTIVFPRSPYITRNRHRHPSFDELSVFSPRTPNSNDIVASICFYSVPPLYFNVYSAPMYSLCARQLLLELAPFDFVFLDHQKALYLEDEELKVSVALARGRCENHVDAFLPLIVYINGFRA